MAAIRNLSFDVMKLNEIFELGVGTKFKYKGFPALIHGSHSWNEYVGETQKGDKLFDRGFVVHFTYNNGKKEKNVVLRTNHPDPRIINMVNYSI
jgi:hypothetical protein